MSTDSVNEATPVPFRDGYDALQWIIGVSDPQGEKQKVPGEVYISEPDRFRHLKSNISGWAKGQRTRWNSFSSILRLEEESGQATDSGSRGIVEDLCNHLEELVKRVDTDEVSEWALTGFVYSYPDIGASIEITDTLLSSLERVKEDGSTASELGEMAKTARECFPQADYRKFGKLLTHVSQPSISEEYSVTARNLRRLSVKGRGERLNGRVVTTPDAQSRLLDAPSTSSNSADIGSGSRDESASPARSLYDGLGGSGASAVSR
ncbi:hypothetical protein NliqN6_6280 [Naganishia liquefaciens]|uniref:Uncharacterized protein n=1 Tax=Naganishia liquefaciens TaxID=104408 RepID=A0A8H3TZE5_9TREE|nr:hypothetical protein NliqN6_6280 [Naganishia liquefaciens]